MVSLSYYGKAALENKMHTCLDNMFKSVKSTSHLVQLQSNILVTLLILSLMD